MTQEHQPVTREDLAAFESRMPDAIRADVTNVNAAAELRLGNLESRVRELEKRLSLGEPRQ